MLAGRAHSNLRKSPSELFLIKGVVLNLNQENTHAEVQFQ